MSKTEDANIRAAIQAVASYEAARYKRELIKKIEEEIAPQISKARLQGASVNTTDLFLKIADKYVN